MCVRVCKCRYRLPGGAGSPDVKWHVERLSLWTLAERGKEKPNKNRHSLYKKLQHNCTRAADGVSSPHHPLHPPPSAPLHYNITPSFFNHASLFYLKTTAAHIHEAAEAWLACLMRWERISSSGCLLQSSLSTSAQFTWLPVCSAHHYTPLCWVASPEPTSIHFHWLYNDVRTGGDFVFKD